MDITGQIKVSLRVASDAEDTAFCAKIVEVMSNGKAYNMRTIIGSLAYRNGSDDGADYFPGEFVDLVLESWDVSWRLQKGSRLRVDITSSDFPQYAVHPNKKDLWCMVREPVKAKQTIDCEHSFVLLPKSNL